MTMQEIFDKVSAHLLKQMCRSAGINPKTGKSVCLYRGVNGLSCAIGTLIPDELYDKEIECKNVQSLPFDIRLAIGYPSGHTMLGNFMIALQMIHDENEPEKWDERLRTMARVYNLQVNF